MRKCARLRIEFLIQQMAFRPQIASHADALHFSVTPAICWMSRSAARCALTVKELERQQRKLQSWAEVPGVDQERINELRHQLKQSSSTLMAAPRIGQFLREDRLIALVRQRLSILAAAAASIYRPCISGSICHRRIATSRWPAGLPASIRWSSP